MSSDWFFGIDPHVAALALLIVSGIFDGFLSAAGEAIWNRLRSQFSRCVSLADLRLDQRPLPIHEKVVHDGGHVLAIVIGQDAGFDQAVEDEVDGEGDVVGIVTLVLRVPNPDQPIESRDDRCPLGSRLASDGDRLESLALDCGEPISPPGPNVIIRLRQFLGDDGDDAQTPPFPRR